MARYQSATSAAGQQATQTGPIGAVPTGSSGNGSGSGGNSNGKTSGAVGIIDLAKVRGLGATVAGGSIVAGALGLVAFAWLG